MSTPAQLNQLVAPPVERPPLEDRAALVGEIAERLVELEELQNGMASDLIFKLAQLFQINPLSFRLALEGLSGNTNALTVSWQHLADKIGARKQTHHHAYNTALREIRATFPHLADALEKIRFDSRGKFAAPEEGQPEKDHLHV